nr:ABC transporter ATP-binding protein [Gloeothece citriformis]
MKLPLKQYWHLLAHYLRSQKNRVYWLSFALLGSIGLQVVNPQILRYFIDTAVAGGSSQSLLIAALLFLGIAVIIQVLMIIATYFGEMVAWTATNNLRLDLVHHCLNLDLSFHKSHTPGELLERIDGDVNTLSQFFSQFTLIILGNGLLLLGILGVLFYENWRVGISMTLFTTFALGALLRLHTFAIPYWGTLRQVSAEFFGFIGEHFSGFEDIKANGATGYVMHRFHSILQRWLPLFYRARLASTYLWAATIGLFSVGQVIALAISAYLWYRNNITIGTVFVIFYYADLLNQPIERIRIQLEDLQAAQASIYRVQNLLQVQPTINFTGKQHFSKTDFSVVFDGVYFSYESENEKKKSLDYALSNISFTLPSGEILGILGHTGSGKTTLARLLLRLYDPQKGCIRIGGIPINQVSLSELRHQVGLVTQDVQLFQTTVRNNLTFFDSSIEDTQILKILEMLGLSSWLYSLPNGLDTHLGADSSGLSAGQAQLLAFARIFLKQPNVIILDEASSRIDPATEIFIEQAISHLFEHRTGIIIAHRLATLQRADRILILDNGRILEYGKRQDLLNNPNSRFSQLLEMGVQNVLV